MTQHINLLYQTWINNTPISNSVPPHKRKQNPNGYGNVKSYYLEKMLEVVGIFELRAEIDQSLALISHDLAQKFKSLQNETLSIRIKTSDLFVADKIAYESIPENTGLISSSWKETHGTLFEAIQFEKLLIGLMLFLIVS